jgi:hypothetical protein
VICLEMSPARIAALRDIVEETDSHLWQVDTYDTVCKMVEAIDLVESIAMVAAIDPVCQDPNCGHYLSTHDPLSRCREDSNHDPSYWCRCLGYTDVPSPLTGIVGGASWGPITQFVQLPKPTVAQ